MNKTYKSIFNESTGTYVAVSETAKSKSKTKGAALIAALLLGATLPITPITALAAGPSGPPSGGGDPTGPGASEHTEVVAGTNVASVTSALGANGQRVYTVNANGTTVSAAASGALTVAGTPGANNVTDYAVDLSQTTKDDIKAGVDAKDAIDNTGLTFNGDTGSTGIKRLGDAVAVIGDTNITTEATAAGVAIKLNPNINLGATGSVTMGNIVINNAGLIISGGPSVTSAGIDAANNKITKLTAGDVNSTSTDAVNGSQLYAVSEVANKGHNVTTAATGTGTVTGTAVTNVAPGDTVTYTAGNNIEVTQNGKEIQIATSLTPTFTTVNTTNLNTTGVTNLGGTTNITGDAYYTGPITNGDNIVNKTYVDQMAAAAKTEVVAGTNVTNVATSTGANGQTIYTVNANGTTASAGSAAVTVVAGTKDANNVTDYVVDLSDDTKQSLVDADTALQTVVTQIDGKDVKTLTKTDNTANFVSGKNITLSDDGLGGIEVATADDVTFTNVNTTNLYATGETKLGDKFTVTKAGDVTYTGPITGDTHIVNKAYVDNSVTTLANNPLTFAGDTGTDVARKLGETLNIVGGNTGTLTDGNIGIEGNGTDTLTVKLASDLSGLNSITINGGPVINNAGINMNGGTITNLAAGVADTDAVNVSQLKEVSNVANAGWNIATDSGTASNVKPGDTVNMKGDGSVVVSNTGNDVTVGLADVVTVGKGDSAVTIDGTKGTIQAGTEVAIDGNTGVIQAGDVTINGDKGTVNGLSNTTWDANNIVKGQAATEDQLKAVADNVTTAVGAAKTEVEAGKNVTVSSQLGDKGQTVYTVATKDEVDFNKVTVGGLTIDKGDVDVAGNTIISGVGAGEISSTSTDAVNGSQLYATNQQVDQNTTNIAKNTTDITNINTTLDKGLNFSADSGSTVNRKFGDTVAITGDGKNITTTTTANGVQIKLSDNIDVKNVNVSQSITVAEGATVNMGGNVIQNVGAGEISSTSTDAVSGSQLYATNQQVAQNTTNIAKNTTDITNINTTLDKGLNFSADSGSTINRKLGDTVAITGDGNITTTTTANGVQVKLSDSLNLNDITVNQSFSVTEGATVNMGGNVVQNVAPGVVGTDAVNVNQLNNVAGNLNNRITHAANTANAGVAQAIATASLMQVYSPGKSMMSVGGGTYQGETGFALSISSLSDSGKWGLKVTGSGNSRGNYGAGMSVGYIFN